MRKSKNILSILRDKVKLNTFVVSMRLCGSKYTSFQNTRCKSWLKDALQ